MKSYTTGAGDTWVTVARKVYALSDKATMLQAANPGIPTPIPVGTVLNVPDDTLLDPTTAQGVTGSEIVVLIKGTKLTNWTAITLTRSMDGIDTVAIRAPYHTGLFTPFTYSDMRVLVDGELLFTGTMLFCAPEDDGSFTVEGYSKPGVLNDCMASKSKEYKGQTLQQIAEELCAPFGIRVVFSESPGRPFVQAALTASTSVLDFLVDLGHKRKLMLRSTTKGELEFYRPEDTPVMALFTDGESPLLSVSADFKPQEYYSSITGISQESLDTQSARYTLVNPMAKGFHRPFVFTVGNAADGASNPTVAEKILETKGFPAVQASPKPKTSGNDLVTSVHDKFARMFGNAAKYTIEVATWRTALGKLFEPYHTVTVDAPRKQIYRPSNFHVRVVTFRGTPTDQKCTLELAIHGAFGGSLPPKMPWEV